MPTPKPKPKPKLAVIKLASCDGCQLSLLDCEDELLAVAGAVDIAYFPEASSRLLRGPYDVTLVEGSVTTAADRERLAALRRESRLLITIGACATSGGIQALRNFQSYPELARSVYAHPEYLDSLATSSGVAEHIPVDYELRGCPVDKSQLLEVLIAALHGRAPRLPRHSVCLECKRRGVVCVTVAHGTPCLGPVTQTGCGALCPRFSRGCFGCFGPSDTPRVQALAPVLASVGATDTDVARLYGTFNVGAPAFGDEHRVRLPVVE